MNARRLLSGSVRGLKLTALLAGVLLSSCAAAPFLIPSILEFGRNLLITSNSNYGNKYREDMNQLLMSVSRSWVNTPYPQRYQSGGFPGQPGQPGMPFPGQMGQPMPGQPMPGFPGGGDPNNPFGQQGQPGMPFPGQQSMPGQQPMPGQPMPGYPGGPDPNNPFGQTMPGQPMPGMTAPMPPSGSVPAYPGGPAPYPGGYPAQGYPSGGASSYPGQPQQGYPPGQSFPPQGYPQQPSTQFPGQPGMGYPVNPSSSYPDPNNPYGQYPGGVPQGQQGYQGYPSSNPSMGNSFPGGMNPASQPGMNQGYPGGMPGASPGMPGSSYPDPNNPYGQYPPGSQPGYSGYPPGGAQNSGFPNQGMPGNSYPGATAPYPSGMPNQPQPYGGNPTMGMPPGSSPGMPGMSQPGYPPMPQGSPYGQPPQQGFPQAQPNFQGGPPQGYPPTGGYPGMAYQGMPMPRGIGPVVEPLELDVALLRQVTTASGKQVTIMQDGEVLKDGRGNSQLGDKFKVVFRTNADCFMYVIAIDGSGWAEGLLPSPENALANPVAKDREYTFPDGDKWLSLDQVRGIETLYFIASPGARPDIEEAVRKIEGTERPAVTQVAQVQEPAILPSGFGATLAGEPTQVKVESGRQLEITPTTYRAAQPGDDVRVTRWFKHE